MCRNTRWWFASAGAGRRPLIQEGQLGTRFKILRRGTGYIQYMCKGNRIFECDKSSLDLNIKSNSKFGSVVVLSSRDFTDITKRSIIAEGTTFVQSRLRR